MDRTPHPRKKKMTDKTDFIILRDGRPLSQGLLLALVKGYVLSRVRAALLSKGKNIFIRQLGAACG